MIAHYYFMLRYDLTPILFIFMHDLFYYLIILLVSIDFLINCHTCFTLFSKDLIIGFKWMLRLTTVPFNRKNVFVSYFIFSYKNKTKISDDSKSFSKKLNFHQINKKTSFVIKWEHIVQNAGSIIFYLS